MTTTIGPEADPHRFELRRLLGRGAMGAVYEARDQSSGQLVALKTLHDNDPQHLVPLKREFRAMQGIYHPNLVRLGELFQSASTWFFTMELVDGRDYLSWLNRSRAAADDTNLDFTALAVQARHTSTMESAYIESLRHTLPQLASALQSLHSAGLVHRDVKPSNILVTPSGRLVLLDFGLVRATADDVTWTQAGTPAYMAPEQDDPEPVTGAADCYAVGVILYQALTGQLPFTGGRREVIERKRALPATPPHALALDVPPDLDALCLELLAIVPEARPTATAIADRVRRPDAPADVPPIWSRPTVFGGRDEELLGLEAALAVNSDCGATVVVIEGESGIGKTALLTEALDRLVHEPGRALVLRGQCFEREVVAYAGLDSIVDALVEHLRRLDRSAAFFAPRHLAALRVVFPHLGAVSAFAELAGPPSAQAGQEAKARAASAFKDLFARVAVRYQLVLVIDDAHWLTPDSRSLLSSLLSGDDPVPLRILLATREPEAPWLSPWLDELPCRVTRLALGPLSSADSLAFLRAHLVGCERDVLAALAEDGAGHPFLLRELVLVGARAPVASLRVEDVLHERARRLSADRRCFLDTVCVARGPVDERAIAKAASVDVADLPGLLMELVVQRWVIVSRTASCTVVQPAHDRIRQARLGRMEPAARRELQRRLAEALELRTPEDVELLALQWNDAGDPVRAAPFATRAAGHAMAVLAFERAAELYALALCGIPPSEHAAVWAAIAGARASAGRGADAAAAYLEGAKLCIGRDADDMTLRAADQLIRAGRIGEGKRLLTGVLEELGLGVPATRAAAVRALIVKRLRLRLRGTRPRKLSIERASEATRRIDACWPLGDLLAVLDPLRAAVLHTEGLLLALSIGEPFRLIRSLCLEAAFVSMSGGRTRRAAEARLAHAIQLAAGVEDRKVAGYISLGHGVMELQLGEFAPAQEHLDRAEAHFEACPGAQWEVTTAREFAMWTLAYRGDLSEIGRRLPTAVEVAHHRGERLAVFKLQAGPSHLHLLAVDEPQRLLLAADLAPLGLSAEEYPFLAFCALFSQVEALIYLGRAGDALETLVAARRPVELAYLLHSQFSRIDLAYLQGRAALARLAEPAGADYHTLPAIVRACSRQLRREGVRWAVARAAALDASLAILSAPRHHAIAACVAAADQLEAACLRGAALALRWQVKHRLSGQIAASVDLDVVRPDRLAQTLAPLPLRFERLPP